MQKRRCAAEKWVMREDEPSQVHDPRCRAEEGSTVVSTVKDTRAASSTMSESTPCACTAETLTLPRNSFQKSDKMLVKEIEC